MQDWLDTQELRWPSGLRSEVIGRPVVARDKAEAEAFWQEALEKAS